MGGCAMPKDRSIIQTAEMEQVWFQFEHSNGPMDTVESEDGGGARLTVTFQCVNFVHVISVFSIYIQTFISRIMDK